MDACADTVSYPAPLLVTPRAADPSRPVAQSQDGGPIGLHPDARSHPRPEQPSLYAVDRMRNTDHGEIHPIGADAICRGAVSSPGHSTPSTIVAAAYRRVSAREKLRYARDAVGPRWPW